MRSPERYNKTLGQVRQSEGETVPRGFKIFFGVVVLAVLLLAFISASMVVVEPGHRGVLLNSGTVSPNLLYEGRHFKIPVYQKIVQMDVRVNRIEMPVEAVSMDLQDTDVKMVVNYNIIPDKAARVFERIGMGYQHRVIDPAACEAVKTVASRYTAAELVANREKVRAEIKEMLAPRFLEFDIFLADLAITDFRCIGATDVCAELNR